MKVLVCGGRDYNKKTEFNSIMKLVEDKVIVEMIIQGGANGADLLAKEWADKKVIPCLNVPADWKKFGKSAGYKRNSQMIEYKPDLVVAFPGGRGTAMMMKISMDAGIKTVDVDHYLKELEK